MTKIRSKNAGSRMASNSYEWVSASIQGQFYKTVTSFLGLNL